MRSIQRWLQYRWRRVQDPAMLEAYRVTFSNMHGRLVLQHLVDTIYCSVYEGKDPVEMATHNGRRSVVQEILENVDMAEYPGKYRVEIEDKERVNG